VVDRRGVAEQAQTALYAVEEALRPLGVDVVWIHEVGAPRLTIERRLGEKLAVARDGDDVEACIGDDCHRFTVLNSLLVVDGAGWREGIVDVAPSAGIFDIACSDLGEVVANGEIPSDKGVVNEISASVGDVGWYQPLRPTGNVGARPSCRWRVRSRARSTSSFVSTATSRR
jgi:hypothetical protein